ncbi:hypothetical protein CLHUN_07420 [Ruminiclostridium hungatei]|uniref:DUF2508 domain-containing protein n=1 Tax=Ruminiclostridium hungatei TaxID=48256 RepID=A0A1V4SPP1_RUMHU|nr:DUF2508 family protein [Ruminiclostridium hungatei]OPX45804.1 hypothetical protein CLHUN_07420 [Ruminiclostridium hungatei]
MEISLNKQMNKVVGTLEEKVIAADRANLLSEIERVKGQLQEAYNNFDFVQDSLMVDFYTYQIKAYESKFEYLIKKAKEIGLCRT